MNTPDNWKDERIRELTRLLEAVRDNENHLYIKIANLKAINEGLEEEIVAVRKLINEPGIVNFTVEEFGAQINRAEEMGERREKMRQVYAGLQGGYALEYKLKNDWIATVDGLREEIKQKNAEIAALREACKEVLDYEQGVGEYDYSRLSSLERADASFIAWLAIREKVRRALEEQP